MKTKNVSPTSVSIKAKIKKSLSLRALNSWQTCATCGAIKRADGEFSHYVVCLKKCPDVRLCALEISRGGATGGLKGL